MSFLTPNDWHALFHAHESFRSVVVEHEYGIVLRRRNEIHAEDWAMYETHRRLPRHVSFFVFGVEALLRDPRLLACEKNEIRRVKSAYDPLLMRSAWWTTPAPTKLRRAIRSVPETVCRTHGVEIYASPLGITILGPHVTAAAAVHGVIRDGFVYWTPFARAATIALFS